MKTTLLLFAVLMIGVSFGQSDIACGQKYDECSNKLTGGIFDGCSVAKSTIQCYIDASHACADGFEVLFKEFQTLVNDVCASGSTFAKDLMKVSDCMAKNTGSFTDCKMNGNPSNLGQLCGIFGTYLQCISDKEEKVCGSSKAFNDVLNPFKKITAACGNLTDFVFDACIKGNIKCGLEIMNPDFKCTDMEKVAKCVFANVPYCMTYTAGVVIAGFLPFADSYYKQIPDYCNKDSAFRKNFDKSYFCIMTKAGDTSSCVEDYNNKLNKMEQPDLTDVNKVNERAVTLSRLAQTMYDCYVQKMGSPCGTEAESAVNYLLQPLRSAMDEICIKITKKRCNGACGLMAGTWLLLLSLVFLITRYYE